jgi:hypothetical protein
VRLLTRGDGPSSIPTLGKFQKSIPRSQTESGDACYIRVMPPVQAGPAVIRTDVQVKALWRATVIALFSSLLKIYCHSCHFLGRYRQERYP